MAVNDTDEMAFLDAVSKILGGTDAAGSQLEKLLGLLGKGRGLERCALTLLNRKTGELWIEVSHGLTQDEERRGRYRLGEGITGRVVQTGKAIVVPRIGAEATFLDRTRARAKRDKDKISFICVPIKIGSETIGALSVDRETHVGSFEQDLRLLRIVAAMIAQAASTRQTAEEEREHLLEENISLKSELAGVFHPQNMVGTSNAMRTVYDRINRVAPSDATVLIRGESGTGKELVASAIHYASGRASKPFIKVHCAALPETLLESELFGHEKGSFTGAGSQRRGRFEQADAGTILLDEVGDFSPTVQVKLLRALQEREFERVGGDETLRVNVRVLAATNKNIEELLEQGKFREDLYYRLNVFGIYIPPLRERRSDIPLLADHFLEKYARHYRKDIRRISTPAIDLLMIYHWPGNVRELENCIEHAVVMSNENVIHAYHLPPTLQSAQSTGTGIGGSLADRASQFEREMIIEALKDADGNCAQAAKSLSTTQRIFNYRVRKLGIDASRFKVKSGK